MLFKDIKSKKNLLTPLSSDTKVFVCRIPEVLDGVAEHHLNCFCCGDWSGQPPGGEQFGRQLQNERHHCPLHAEFKAGGKIQFSRQSHFALAPFRKPIDTYICLAYGGREHVAICCKKRPSDCAACNAKGFSRSSKSPHTVSLSLSLSLSNSNPISRPPEENCLAVVKPIKKRKTQQGNQ